jgi:cell division initiation protein
MEKFGYEENGYNKEEVNQFISDVIKETEAIVNRVKKQEVEIERLKKEIDFYKNNHNFTTTSIIRAEEAGENIRKIALEESEIIINNAKQNASRIINEALIKAEKLENHTRRLEESLKIYKTKLKIIIEQQKVVIDEMDKISLDS